MDTHVHMYHCSGSQCHLPGPSETKTPLPFAPRNTKKGAVEPDKDEPGEAVARASCPPPLSC